MSAAAGLCAYRPFGSTGCGRPGQYGGFCISHAGKRCVVCEGQATHDCHGTVGSFYCGAQDAQNARRDAATLHAAAEAIKLWMPTT